MAGDIGEVAFGDRVEVIRELESVEFPHAVGTILQVVAPSKGDESIRARAYINGHLYCWSYPRTHLARPGYLQAEIAALTEQLAEARQIIADLRWVAGEGVALASNIYHYWATDALSGSDWDACTAELRQHGPEILARIEAWEAKHD